MKRYQQYIMPVLCLIVVLAVWEFSVQFFGIDLYVLPAPSDIVKAIGSEFGTLWMHSMVTLQEAVIGLLIATVLAVLIAILMDLNRTFRHSVFPYLVVSRDRPGHGSGTTLYHVAGLWTGTQNFHGCLYVLFPHRNRLFRCTPARQPQPNQSAAQFWRESVAAISICKNPTAAPALFSGLKVSATYCIGGAIVGEWLSASAGLGYYMIRVKNGFLMDKVFACVIMIIIWSLLLNFAVTLLERILFPYTRKRKGVS